METEPIKPEEASPTEPESAEKPKTGHHHRLLIWYKTHKKISIPLTVLVVLVILLAIPWTRYNLLGLFIKEDFTIQATDATAHIPVSGATVESSGVKSQTDSAGKATLHLKVGPHQFTLSKKYYQTTQANLTVTVLKKNMPIIPMTATGRQVKIKTTNIISGTALANVNIAVSGITAKTDSTGVALVVLPANSASQKATLSLDGYNSSDVVVGVSNSTIKENSYKLTPAGKIYFLSNQTGKLNLMKANLDGTAPEVALEATGNEQISTTSMIQSGDGKYVALVAKRNASDPTPQLYVISTSDDKSLQVDSGNAIFQLYSWVGDNLIYTVQRQDLPVWQQGASKIKSYDAGSGNTTLLDQSAGSNSAVNANEYYSEIMVTPAAVVYGKVWTGTGDISDRQSSLQSIGVTGQNHQTLATYGKESTVNFARHGATTLYIWEHQANTNADVYSQYTVGSSVKPINITSDQFYEGQDDYYFSPSAKQTFWSETRDGKQTLLIGDGSGNNSATIATQSEYYSSGWFTDQYVLVDKDSSELYIMSTKGGNALKIADFQNAGYGYGYGGH